ncbi:MAG: type IV toxin-antitoxin system AbiEi family antitoxin [Thermodesulfobacteriota bacterium]
MGANQKTKKTQVGVELIRRIAAEGDRLFTTERARELAHEVGLKDSYLAEALYHLRRNGWIVSLRRGLYALTSPMPGIAPAHEFEVAMALVHPAAISHWSALHHHGLTEQAPRKVFVLTTTTASLPRMRGPKSEGTTHRYPVGAASYQFIRVRPERFFGIEKEWIGDARVEITDPERTLLDGLSMPQYCGDFSEVLHAFAVRGETLDVERIIRYACKLDTATAKRLGWVLQLQGIDPARLEPLFYLPIKGYRKLDPTGPRKGPYNRHWMIQENLPGKVMT